MYKDIKNFTRSCQDCNEVKGFKPMQAPLQRAAIPQMPMEKVSMDIVGPLPASDRGHKYILGITDHFTRYTQFSALRDQTAQAVASKLMKFISVHGVPQSLLTDQGTNFQSEIMKQLAKQLGIKQIKTTAYRPQSNGISERSHKAMQNCLSCLAKNTKQWHKYLPLYNLFYNNSFHETIKTTPAFLIFGRNINLPYDLLQQQAETVTKNEYIDNLVKEMKIAYDKTKTNLEQAAEKQETIKNRNAKLRTFHIGQYVYLFTPRINEGGKFFSRKYSGPWQIIEKHSNVNYSIKNVNNPNSKVQRVHINRLFPYTTRDPELELTVPKQLFTDTLPKSPQFPQYEEEMEDLTWMPQFTSPRNSHILHPDSPTPHPSGYNLRPRQTHNQTDDNISSLNAHNVENLTNNPEDKYCTQAFYTHNSLTS